MRENEKFPIVISQYIIKTSTENLIGNSSSFLLSYLRARLIQKGTLFTDGRSLRFLIPGMARWIAQGDDD